MAVTNRWFVTTMRPIMSPAHAADAAWSPERRVAPSARMTRCGLLLQADHDVAPPRRITDGACAACFRAVEEKP